ncbi:MAG: metal-dependent transcriptional regulator, partial [Nitrososphaerota archaeon]
MVDLSQREIDYLIVVFKKCREVGYARNKEIVKELNVSKSTASLMLKKLSKMGLIKRSRRRIELTSRGKKTLTELSWRHCVVECALSSLGVSPKDSCRAGWKIGTLLSKEMIEELWEKLGRPEICPCGLKIPDIPQYKEITN